MRRVLKIFVDKQGALRWGWRLLVGVFAYALAFYTVLWGFAALFGALFSAWNLTNENLIYAPKWAQTIVLWHADFTYVMAYCAAMRIVLRLAWRWTKEPQASNKGFASAALIGLGLGALLTAASLGFDSMRLEQPLSEPVFSVSHMNALAVLLVGCFSGEMLTKRFVFESAKQRFGRVWGYVAACVVMALLSGMWNHPAAVINALLMSIVGCAVYERGGSLASTALSAGWSAWTTWLFAWPGSSSVSIYRMYTVSEAWLTGGNAGANCGLGATVGWLIIAAILLWNDLKKGIAEQKKERKTNGKDSHCNRRSGFERRKLLWSGASGNAGPRSGRRAG